MRATAAAQRLQDLAHLGAVVIGGLARRAVAGRPHGRLLGLLKQIGGHRRDRRGVVIDERGLTQSRFDAAIGFDEVGLIEIELVRVKLDRVGVVQIGLAGIGGGHLGTAEIERVLDGGDRFFRRVFGFLRIVGHFDRRLVVTQDRRCNTNRRHQRAVPRKH